MFPGLICPRTMFHFVTVVIFCDLLQLIENRICPGIDGDECCFGFSLNRATRKCEKCPIGYHGTDCERKCIYPTYGEDCQSRCQCSYDTCHFSNGCLPNVDNFTEYQELGLTRTYSISKEFSSPPVITDLSTRTHKHTESTRENLPKNYDLLKNNIVISLLGIFVFFSSIFVISYIYLKCFRNKSITSVANEIGSQAHYKALNFNLIEPENTGQSTSSRQTEMDSAYLLPVFTRNEDSEVEIKLESDKPIVDNTNHRFETTNRHTLDWTTGSAHDHVYIEINNEDNTDATVDNSFGKQVSNTQF